MGNNLESTFFLVEIEGAVAHLVMNRGEKANSMTPEFWQDLPRLVRQLENNPSIRALVVSASGRNFTAGMDLSSFNAIAGVMEAEPGRAAYALRDLVIRLQDAFNALEEARFPVIAAIHGACIGGGIDMTSACDIRLATNDATFSIEEIHIGITADLGTLQRLPKLIAPGIVRELAYTGRRFSAREAQTWGFTNALYDSREDVVAAALQMAREIAAKSPLAIAGIKRGSVYARDHSVADGLDQIATWNGAMLRPQDLMAAMQAKMAKKEAEFADLLAAPGL
ncbi:MAG: crotonase/enoyl-CoA hydratase family protein [Fimbriimonadaceae bacterium]|nr:crotonase/enoyl-CoA hydratase family protein [Alphaproteobacteria bacterium]